MNTIDDIKGQDESFYSITGEQAEGKSKIPKLKIASNGSDLIQSFRFGDIVYLSCQDGDSGVEIGNQKKENIVFDVYFLKVDFIYQTKYSPGSISKTFRSAEEARSAGYLPFSKEEKGVFPAARTFILVDLSMVKDKVFEPIEIGGKTYGIIEHFFSSKAYNEIIDATHILRDKKATPLWAVGFKLFWEVEIGSNKKEYFKICLAKPFDSEKSFVDSLSEQLKKKRMIVGNSIEEDSDLEIPF